MKTILSSALVASLLLFSGCSDSSSSTPSSETSLTTVTVERGPILGAVVLDAEGQQATQDASDRASYTFETPPVYPISVYGGYIDVNRNGVIDAGEVENTIVLTAESGEVITLLTTMLAVADENSSSFFLDDLGLNSALTPTKDMDISALSDVVYAYLIEHNLASVDDINTDTMKQLKEQIELKIQEYASDDLDASEQEAILVLKLGIKKLDDADADDANEKIRGQEHAAEVIANLPNMSDKQKEHVIAMILKNSDKKEKSDDDAESDEGEADDDADDEEADNDAESDEAESGEEDAQQNDDAESNGDAKAEKDEAKDDAKAEKDEAKDDAKAEKDEAKDDAKALRDEAMAERKI